MPRRPKSKNNKNEKIAYRFEWVTWTPDRLKELREWIDGNNDSLEDRIRQLLDSGWKVSASENLQSGRYLVSLTDKWDREGCAGVSFGIEHSDVVSAYLGASYYAIEIIGDKLDPESDEAIDDLW